ncbi:hypothetical protein L195_g062478, partial [Trifolium pratense]
MNNRQRARRILKQNEITVGEQTSQRKPMSVGTKNTKIQ